MLPPPIPHPSASGAPAPIVDLRGRLAWAERLPARLGTAALWLGSLSLLGPVKLCGLLLVTGLVGPGLLWFDRGARRQAALALPPSALLDPFPGEALSRAALAAELGLAESQLFRARHAPLCTVHHDAGGRIVALELPAAAEPIAIPTPDAHPVG